jgi:hypothetical protein
MAIFTQRTPFSLALPKIMSGDPGQVKHRPPARTGASPRLAAYDGSPDVMTAHDSPGRRPRVSGPRLPSGLGSDRVG